MNLLITKNDLIEHCAVSENADDKRINVAIQQAHNKLQSLICRQFYNELKAEFLGDSLTAANEAIIEYIKMYLVWNAYRSFIFVGSVANTAAGFREFTDTESQPADNARLNMLKQNADEQSDFWRGELFHFLNDNIDNYPTFKNSDCYNCKKKDIGFSLSGAGKYEIYKRFRRGYSRY